jgi:hypothetical protein
MKASPKIGVVALLLVALGGSYLLGGQDRGNTGVAASAAATAPADSADAAWQAFQSRASGRIITAKGMVERTLADDRDGSPHQRFIIRTSRGLSLLIAHNLELAPRLDGLAVGDSVTVLGEYEWNEKGGVMHWTHDDPQGHHRPGYIEWRGRRYQ